MYISKHTTGRTQRSCEDREQTQLQEKSLSSLVCINFMSCRHVHSLHNGTNEENNWERSACDCSSVLLPWRHAWKTRKSFRMRGGGWGGGRSTSQRKINFAIVAVEENTASNLKWRESTCKEDDIFSKYQISVCFEAGWKYVCKDPSVLSEVKSCHQLVLLVFKIDLKATN